VNKAYQTNFDYSAKCTGKLVLTLSCVKWGKVISYLILLPIEDRSETRWRTFSILLGIFIHELAQLISKANVGCRVGGSCTAVFLYAQDALLAPSVGALQTLVNICASATELEYLDMAINVNKSACLRFGSRFKNHCVNITVCGQCIEWVTSTKYFGVYLESSTGFKCSFSHHTGNASFFIRTLILFSENLVVWFQKKTCLH